MTLDDLVEQTWRKESNRVNCSLTVSVRVQNVDSNSTRFFVIPANAGIQPYFVFQTKNKPLQTYGALSNSRAP
jgi:prephenate dehydratase